MAKSEDIIRSRPADRTAALVTSKGVHYEPDLDIEDGSLWKDRLPPMAEYPPDLAPLHGTRRGRAKVFGYHPHGRLVVRCDCGNYELRSVKNWRRGLRRVTPDGGCAECRHLQQMKRNEEYRRLGRNFDEYKPAPGPVDPIPSGFVPTKPIWKGEPPRVIEIKGGSNVGTKMGGLTIVGHHSGLKSYVVQCECGNYELRGRTNWKSKSLAERMASDAMCQECAHKGIKPKGPSPDLLSPPKPSPDPRNAPELVRRRAARY